MDLCCGMANFEPDQDLSSDFSLSCCNTPYCSKRCRDMALNSYHNVLCGENFDWPYEECRTLPKAVALNGLLWLRILAICVQSKLHPLDHPAIARLTPNYQQSCRKWSLSTMIRQPVQILEQLGVNPLKDTRYETWVLHTVWARVLNNQVGDGVVQSVSPLYSFFNHSCEPNAQAESPSGGGSTKVMFATKKIKKGDEIFISYGGFTGTETKAERDALLASWIGSDGQCGCPKCQREV